MRVAVEYILGRAHAAVDPRSPSAEWPPHPARLFSALTAAAKETGMGAEGDGLLRWIEQLPAPDIACSDATESPALRRFVPVNWLHKSKGQMIRTLGERWFPSTSPAQTVVSFVWPEVSEWPDSLPELASRVSRLGSSASFVRVWIDSENPQPTWTPARSGKFFGVPHDGRLAELESAFDNGDRPPAPKAIPYNRPQPRVANSEWNEMIILRRVEGPRVDSAFTVPLTEALRAALMKSADALGVLVPEIHGHSDDGTPIDRPHCAYVALPNVGGTHSDGTLAAVAILLPAIEKPTRRKILAAVGGIETVTFSGLSWRVEECGPSDRHTLRPSTWTRPSREWASAIPIQLPVWRNAEEVIRNTCRKLSLPEPQVSASLKPMLTGAVEPLDISKSRRTGRRCLTVHARLRFPVPVAGPLVIGVQRHFGCGLLKPVTAEGTSDDR